MNRNVDMGSAVECTAAQPRLTKSPKEEENSLYVFFCIGASINIGQEIWCLPYVVQNIANNKQNDPNHRIHTTQLFQSFFSYYGHCIV